MSQQVESCSVEITVSVFSNTLFKTTISFPHQVDTGMFCDLIKSATFKGGVNIKAEVKE